MDDPINPNDAVPQVAQEIPSAVRATSSWNTPFMAAFAVVGLLVVFVLKGASRKPIEAQAAAVAPDAPTWTPPASLASLPAPSPSPMMAAEGGENLRDIRRKSPMVIFNNTMTGTATPLSPEASNDPTLPMPPGYHPSKDAQSHSTSLGDREFIIAQGKLIDAVLETALNTDQPGMLRALVSDDIYGDSGRTVLLPRGSRLIGQYNADIARGQSRVFVIWQRVIRPDGIDVTLDSGGTDPLGQAGVHGQVNNHFFTMFGAATLLSMIGASASTVAVNPADNANSLATYRSSVSQGFSDAAGTVLGTFVRIKPTIKVRQGTAIKVLVARDLYFDPAVVGVRRVQVIP